MRPGCLWVATPAVDHSPSCPMVVLLLMKFFNTTIFYLRSPHWRESLNGEYDFCGTVHHEWRHFLTYQQRNFMMHFGGLALASTTAHTSHSIFEELCKSWNLIRFSTNYKFFRGYFFLNFQISNSASDIGP